MLPWLKENKEASVSEPVGHQLRKADDGEYDSLHSAAEDLISAIHSKDIKAVAVALRAAFEIVDSQPHEEGEHV